LQILDNSLDIARIEHEDGHVGVARDNTFGERFCEILDGVFSRQGPQWWCLRVGAITLLANRVAS
jgi:hypothetical protein